jgi:hypothetical protein
MNLNSLLELSGGLTICLTTVPFLIVALVFVYVWRRNNQRARASQQWAETMGIVGASDVQMRRSSNSEGGTTTSYYPEIFYEYTVAGTKYVGQRVNFGSAIGYGNRNTAQAIADRYVPGNPVRVHYNPVNPADAVLEREAGTSSKIFYWAAVFILLLLCITVVPMVLMLGGMNAMFSGFPFLR